MHYGGGGGSWKKEGFHDRLDEAIVDLNRYRFPEYTEMDTTAGLANDHLGGARFTPPADRILASSAARALDRAATGLLEMARQDVGHLRE